MKLHGGVGNVELVFYSGGKDVPVGTNGLLVGCRHGKHYLAVARNGVVHLARVERGETQICLLLLLVEEAVENFDGVGALLVDVIS